MKRFLEDAIAGDGAVFWAFGIALATGLSFVGAANAIDQHFKWNDCVQRYSAEQCAQLLNN